MYYSRFAVRNSKKKVTDQLLVCRIGELWRPEWFQTDCIWVQVILLIIQDQFYTIQNLQRSPIPQTSNWSSTFFAVSYSKLVLELPIIDQLKLKFENAPAPASAKKVQRCLTIIVFTIGICTWKKEDSSKIFYNWTDTILAGHALTYT